MQNSPDNQSMIPQLKMNTETTYSSAGVDTERAEQGLKHIIRRVLHTWPRDGGMGSVALDIGQFANVINIGNNQGVSVTTDGIGTKALIAQMTGKYDTVGIDCVAMNVNDVICVGAKPLTLVDYIAVREPVPNLLDDLAKGLCAGAERAGISISGGEIAQLPDMLAQHESGHTFDLVGTAVGLVNLDKIIVGQDIQEGDAIIGIESNGIHSNGLTLARDVLLKRKNYRLDDTLPELDSTIGDELLKPTYIYVKEIQEIIERDIGAKAFVHITSDGFLNLARIAGNIGYVIEDLCPIHKIFRHIQELGNISDEEMFRVFNMGTGFCIVASRDKADDIVSVIEAHGKHARVIGHTINDDEKRVHVKPYQMVGSGKSFEKVTDSKSAQAVA